MNGETCPVDVWRGDVWGGRYQACGKPVKRRGRCGVHARSADLAEQRKEKRDFESKRAGKAQELAGLLSDKFGVRFTVTNGDVCLSLVDAKALLVLGDSV